MRVTPSGLLLLTGLLAWVSPGQAAQKTVTVADVTRHAEHVNTPVAVWRPDGRAFAYQQDGQIFFYDVATHKAKEWFRLRDLEKDQQPQESSSSELTPFNWQNRRVTEN